MEKELLFTPVKNRFTLFPIKYPQIYQYFKSHEASFWMTEEIDLKEDITHWENLNDDERYFISQILAFFAASDGIVNENLILNFYQYIEIPEARTFYTFQMAMESIHSETYSVLIDTFIKNDQEKTKLFDAIHNFPCVKGKADWALKWIDSKHLQDLNFSRDQILVRQLLAFIIVEGLFFSGSFCSIFWLKNRGLMPGLSFSNELISRDENIHMEFGIHLYSLVSGRCSEKEVHEMFLDAINIEEEFITSSLPVSLIGMNCETMKSYIRFVADNILYKLGYSKIFNISECPFQFMELLSFSGGNSKVNFFEKRNPDYQKANIMNNTSSTEINFDESF